MMMAHVFDDYSDAVLLAKHELEREGLASIFDRYEWFERTLAQCPILGQPLVTRASGHAGDCWLFLSVDDQGRAQGLGSWYTLAYRPIFTGVANIEEKLRLLANVAGQLRSRLSTICLSPMHEEDCRLTAEAFRSAGWLATARVSDCNWTANVAGLCFDEYWAARPGKLRKTVKSKQAKADMATHIYTHFDEGAWADYEAVYAQSWKPEEGSMGFLRSMAQSEGAAGTLRLGIGRIAGEAVAAQLWTCENDVAIAHKVAHRMSAVALSPGTLLSAKMFEQAIDIDRVARIDFGTGDSGYKSAWMDDCAPLYTLELFNKNRVSAIARAVIAKAKDELRALRSR
ncbi:MAG: GNAT family N-acetyltransferase [Sphingopyxis sp.]